MGPIPLGLSVLGPRRAVARVTAGAQGSAAPRGGIPLHPLGLGPWACLEAPLLPSQAVAGGPGAAWAGSVSSKEGLECALSRWQPVQDTHGGGKALLACSQTEGPHSPPTAAPHPCPHQLPVPAILGFALASSQTPECACWLRSSCSWNRGDKAPPVSELGRTGRARPAPRMNRAQSPGPRMNGLTDAQTPMNGPRASKDAVELGTGHRAWRPGTWGANHSGSVLVKSLVKGEESPPNTLTHSMWDSGTRERGAGRGALTPRRVPDTGRQGRLGIWRPGGEAPAVAVAGCKSQGLS